MPTSSEFPTDNQYIKYRIVVTENSYSIPNNTSSVTVKVQAWRTNTGYTTSGSGTCYCAIYGTVYTQSISSSQKIEYKSYTTLFSKTVTIPHNPDGSRNIFVESKITHSRFSASYHGFTVPLTQIPRQANITAVVDFTDEQNPTITYSNPAGDVVEDLQACISLTGSTDNVPYRPIDKLGTTYTFQLTEAERTTLRNACPNSNTLTVYFYVRTVIAGQTYWSNMPATMTIVNANPTITGATYKDNNATTVAITDNDQIIIQNHSQLLFNFSSLTALKSATLTSIEVTINSIPKSMSLSGASKSNVSLSFGQLNVSSNISASITLTDSRNNKTTISVAITVEGWSAPTAIIKLARVQNYYSDTDLYVNADFSSLGGKNSITITYYYKLTTASTWTTGGTMSDDSTVTMNLDNTQEWNVKVEITDLFYTTSYQLAVDKGIPIIFFDRSKRSVGVNCFPENDESFEVDGVDILKAIQYQSGDVQEISNFAVFNGYISDSATQIGFSIPLPKSMGNLTPTLTELKVNVRTADGGYIFSNSYSSTGYDIINDSDCTVVLRKPMENMLSITIDRTTAHDTTNNTTISVMVMSAEISFA